MASPAAIHPRIAARSIRLLINSGALLISAGGMFIVHTAAARAPVLALVAFLIFLLGVSLVALALAVTTQQQIDGSALPSAVAAFANHMRAARRVRLIRPQLIAGTAALLATTAGAFIVGAAANPSAAFVDGPRALFLAAFVVFLLGVWLALLALVIMDRVPEAEIGSVTIA